MKVFRIADPESFKVLYETAYDAELRELIDTTDRYLTLDSQIDIVGAEDGGRTVVRGGRLLVEYEHFTYPDVDWSALAGDRSRVAR